MARKDLEYKVIAVNGLCTIGEIGDAIDKQVYKFFKEKMGCLDMVYCAFNFVGLVGKDTRSLKDVLYGVTIEIEDPDTLYRQLVTFNIIRNAKEGDYAEWHDKIKAIASKKIEGKSIKVKRFSYNIMKTTKLKTLWNKARG